METLVIESFSPWTALGGGALIGLGATLLMAGLGRIAGISGALNGLLPPPAADRAWRVVFLLGLVAGSAAIALVRGSPLPVTDAAPPLLVAAGLLVGLGSRIGNGCTSGHGVCGLARLSPRSLGSVLTFLLVAMVTVFVVRHLLGSGA